MTATKKRPATRPVSLVIEPAPRRSAVPSFLPLSVSGVRPDAPIVASGRCASLPLPSAAAQPDHRGWFYGGSGDYFPDLAWTRRPADLARSGAPDVLQDAWIATVMAVQEAHGGLRRGSCYYLNLAGAPLIQKVLGEPVQLCAGYGGWIETAGRIETGFRWRPSAWRDWIDAGAGAHLEPTQDVHCWLETATHLIDLDGGTGDRSDTWPPIIFRDKRRLPRHPREARGVGAILRWHNKEARELVGSQMVPLTLPIAAQAVELFDVFMNGTEAARQEASAKHRMVMDLGRRLTSERGEAPITARALEILSEHQTSVSRG